jgi:hypothetical protein
MVIDVFLRDRELLLLGKIAIALKISEPGLDAPKTTARALPLCVRRGVSLFELSQLLAQGAQPIIGFFERALFILETLNDSGGSTPIDSGEIFEFDEGLGCAQPLVNVALLLLQAFAFGVDGDEPAAQLTLLAPEQLEFRLVVPAEHVTSAIVE